MRPGVVPHFVSEFKPFQESTLQCLEEQPAGAFSGISRDGRTCWIVKGSLLEVLDTTSRARLGSWQFGRVLGDQHTSITSVREFRLGQSLKLLVGVCNSSPTGLLCLFDVALSKVVKALEIPQPVTEIEVVSTAVGNKVPRWALSEQLRYFCGLVAVGTSVGYVYLVDMCVDDTEFFSDEEVPSKLHFVYPRNRDTENQRFHCMSQGLHLCMTLNESMFTKNGFEYQKPGGLVMKTFSMDQVSVTCLHYIPQAGILTIGYSFGCYQLWKLHIPVLEYSSRLESEPMPVSHIAYQEPENDPKNFCYIWITRGQLVNDEERSFDTVSTICMYQLAFNTKCYYSNYGVFYEDLSSVCLRLDYELTSTPIQCGSNYDGGSRVTSCYTLSDPLYQPPDRLEEDESFEENSHGPDLSLCVFVWEATDGYMSDKVGRHLAVFDINRWYHAQMPASVRYASGSVDTCAYLCFCKLDEATDRAGSDILLATHVRGDRLRKFVTNSPVPPEQHFYPASLAFDARMVFESGVVDTRFLGSQRQVLADLETKGPVALVQPQDLYNLCLYVGLLPRPLETTPNTLVYQRETLLTLALEYNMVCFIKTCIRQWAAGEYEHQGCTLKLLLDWAWEKVSTTKHLMDTTCTNLYNWSGLALDQRAIQTLFHCSQRLSHLVSVFRTFLSAGGPITPAGEAELQSKILVTSLIGQHLEVVLWFVETGLLPECDDTEITSDSQYCYPATSLILAYKNRRAELQAIHSDIGEMDLLMIDGLVENLKVHDLWDREGGTGLYPPPSLHALLSTYLLEDVDMVLKHCLVLYLLLDLVSVDSSDIGNQAFSERVSKFACRFSLPHTLLKLIQAFWLLDHKAFEEAMKLLLDPMVSAEFSRWQHRRIIKALLYQGDSKMALRYINSVQPALTSPEEVKLKLTVLLANGLTAEALEYQRRCRDQNNMQDLLTHLFLGCQQTKTVDRLLQLPLTTQEEAMLVDYLQESSEPHSQELLVMHYLQRARFVEAIQLNEKLKHSILTDSSSKARERATARNAIVDSFAAILPSVQRKLLFEQVHVPKKTTQCRREVRRPTPLSTKITKNRSSVMSQSAFIMTIMEKLDELEPEEEQDRTEVQNKSVGPFICTPVTPARSSLRHTPATGYPESGTTEVQAGFSLQKSLTMFQNPDTPSNTSRRESKFMSASCMTLLQTPVVKKLTPQKQRLSNNVITPQSILKVRHMISTTSPSPHSGPTTPNSQELEGSARKLPRRLGYGAASQPGTPRSVSFSEQPLSSIPRHLTGEITQASSQSGSPKSVSFAEPPSPANVSRVSQPTTPKSVSFMENRSFLSASQMQPLSTPKQLRFAAEPSSSASKSRWSKSPTTPEGPRSVKDRSPTPESPEKSPRYAGRMDQLLRPPLRTTPTKEEDALELQLEASDDDNISDDGVEEMEAGSPAADVSITSTSTVKQTDDLHISVSSTDTSQSQSAEKASPSASPPSSPTVKVSRSPRSEYAASSSAENVFETESVVSETKVNVGDVDGEVMEVEGNDIDETSHADEGKSYKEIFDEDEEIKPPGDVEGMEIEEEEMGVSPDTSLQQEVEVVSQSIKQEVEDEVYAGPPQPVRQLEVPEPPSQEETQTLKRKSLTPPKDRHLPFIKTKDSPPSRSEYEAPSQSTAADLSIVKKSSPKHVDDVLSEIDQKFADSPTQEDQVVSTSGQEPVHVEQRSRRKFNISPVKIEPEPSTPTRSSRRAQKSVKQEEVVTPTRSSRRHRKVESDVTSEHEETVTTTRSSRRSSERLVEVSAVSPKPFSSDAKRAVQESLVQISEDLLSKTEESPERMTQIKDKENVQTPTRSSRRNKAATPTRETNKADDGAEVLTPARSTRSHKSSSGTASPAREVKKTTTPRRGRKKEENKGTSPQRNQNQNSRSPLHQSISPSAINADIAASVIKPHTPTRSRRRVNESVIETLDTVVEDAVTPVKQSSRLHAEEEGSLAQTPRRDSFGRSDLPEDFEDVNVTPSIRVSLSRSCKKAIEISQQSATPTRRQSLGRSRKTIESETPGSPMHEVSQNSESKTQTSLSRTPSRRGRPKKAESEVPESEVTKPSTPSRKTRKQSESNEVDKTEGATSDEHEAELLTPSRRGRSKKAGAKEEDKVKDEAASSETEVQPLTPSRRGRSRKSSVTLVESGKVTPTGSEASESQPLTPSRRGRQKKGQDETKEEGDVAAAEDESKAQTPSRRGRGRKPAAEEEKESELEKLTPSRRKKMKKDEDQKTLPQQYEVYDIQSSSFQFSDPMNVGGAEESSEPPKAFTPVKSFFFSPPINHTRSVTGVREEEEEQATGEGILLPPGPTVSQPLEQKSTRKTRTRTRKLYQDTGNIALISPMAHIEEDSGEEGRHIVTRTTRGAAKKVTTKKDGTKLLVKSITTRGGGRRTKHRFGPVGQKKKD